MTRRVSNETITRLADKHRVARNYFSSAEIRVDLFGEPIYLPQPRRYTYTANILRGRFFLTQLNRRVP